jgi:DNA-binding NtrC family response regulator
MSGFILIIEDDMILRELLEEVLSVVHLPILMAENGRQGVCLFQRHSDTIQAVILDMGLPDINGLEVLQSILSIAPKTRILITSGQSKLMLGKQFTDKPHINILPKPFNMEDILTAVTMMLTS